MDQKVQEIDGTVENKNGLRKIYFLIWNQIISTLAKKV
jgi:hypothetical protein